MWSHNRVWPRKFAAVGKLSNAAVGAQSSDLRFEIKAHGRAPAETFKMGATIALQQPDSTWKMCSRGIILSAMRVWHLS